MAFAGIPQTSVNKVSKKTGVYKSLFRKAASSGAIKVIKRNGIEGVKFVGKYKPFNRNNYRHNLKVKTGFDPGMNADAHHIFAKGLDAMYLEKFENAGINIHDPKYLVWWKKGKGLVDSHQKNADRYNKDWMGFFDSYIKKGISPSKEKILEFGKKIMKKYDSGNNVSSLNY